MSSNFNLLRTCLVLVVLLLLQSTATSALQCIIEDSLRFDCYPESGATKDACQARGCCWRQPNLALEQKKYFKDKLATNSVPTCFYPKDFPSYSITSLTETDFGYTAHLSRTTKTYYPKDLLKLKMDVILETDTRLHFKIYDPDNDRYEVPIDTPAFTNKSTSPSYSVEFGHRPFSFGVKRNSTGVNVFDTSVSPLIYADQFLHISTNLPSVHIYGIGEHFHPLQLDIYWQTFVSWTRGQVPSVRFDTRVSNLIFADQFLQISTLLPSSYIYGLGEHLDSLVHSTDWKTLALWTRDHGPMPHTNLYSDHPFYIVMENSGHSHGVFLKNSNAMDIVLQPAPALTYRTIGGILDFYIFLGPTPDLVIQQYTEVIGRPFMPPYWSLGFHLCKYGYGTADATFSIVEKMRELAIPQDVQWNDIDSMDKFKDFTIDLDNFALLPDMIDNIHRNGQHYVIMLDPAISSSQPKFTYAPFDDGMAMDVFIKNATDQLLIGKVWPGNTAFPDFTNPVTHEWWAKQISKFHKLIKFDGIWNDMNEPSNFVFGSIDGCPGNNTYENPPYLPSVEGGALASNSICVSAKQNWSVHYNVHNLYGYSETMATHNALIQVRSKRPFVLSRSTFPGSGQHTAHWTGDITSTWDQMYHTIPAMLNFNMFGIPLVGADICGFGGNTTEPLCQRWQQLGAFYPFARNHASIASMPQDPTVFSKAMQDSTRKVLLTRYRLLPYLYTLFHRANRHGSTVARPVFFEYPSDVMTYALDTQFMWGEALMITPVLNENATSVTAYFPQDIWYDYYTGSVVKSGLQKLDAPMDTINLHVRGGYIIPMQYPETTTTESRKNKFLLLAALSLTGEAHGMLFWDDGDSLDTFQNKEYEAMKFTASNNTIVSEIENDGYPGASTMMLGQAFVYGVKSKPNQVIANGVIVQYRYDVINKCLNISGMALPMNASFNIAWSP